MLEDGYRGDTVMVQEPELEPEITLHALTGWTTPKTMCVWAKIGSHKVIILSHTNRIIPCPGGK